MQMSPLQLQQGQFEQNSQQSNDIKLTKPGRKNLCDICTKSLAKYTCPKCQIKSCSVFCINKHKNTNQCSGLPNNAQYLQRKKINQCTVRKDYQFIKSMLNQTDKVKKMLTGVTTSMQQPKRFFLLRKFAKSQYNIKIYQAPAMFQRHRQNISFFYMKTKTIYWVIQLLYYHQNKKYSKHLLQPQPDSKTIQQILPTNYLCPQLLLNQINTQKPSQFDIYIQNKRNLQLQNQQKQHPNKKQQKQIIQLSKQYQIYSSLKNLHIYEFPTFILVHNSLKKSFVKFKNIS